MRSHADGYDADLVDRAAEFAMLAVQGPHARQLVRTLTDGPLPPRMHCCERRVAGAPMLVCGTGYPGEDGVELLLAPDDATGVWDALLDAGATPAGLGARDTLRLEALLSPVRQRSEPRPQPDRGRASGGACKESTGFIGAEAIAAVRTAGPAQKLIPFTIDGPGIARPGNPVHGGGVVTRVTCEPRSITRIGMAYVSGAKATPGTTIEIDVRGTVRPATVATKPLYRKGS